MMKRNLIFPVAAVLLLIIVGYPAGAWYAGKQMEATLEDEYKSLHEFAPVITVSDRQFKRGIFSSEEKATLSITLAPGTPPLRLAVVSHMKHLPFPGIFALQAVAVDSEVALAGDSLPNAAEWTGNQNVATVHTVQYFSGNGKSTLTLPAFNTDKLSSEQGTLSIKYAKGMSSYSMEGNLPRFAIIDKAKGGRFQVSGVQVSADHKRFLAGTPSLYSGSDHVVIEQIDMSGPGMPTEPGFIKHMTVDVAATASNDNEFVDITEKFGLGSLKVVGKDYGPAQFDLSFHHLHAKTVASLAQGNWAAAEKSPAMVAQFMEALLSHNPELTIDKFSFTRPEGETVISALFKLKDAQPGEFSNPMVLMTKGYVSVDFKMPEKLLAEFGQGMFAAAVNQGGGVDKVLESMLAAGYVTREDGFIKTKFEFHDAAPWFNGKPYVQAPRQIPSVPAPHRRR
ncbi:MAG TPA: YdgA family protein [Gallionellaceae bacterium]